MTEPAFQAPPPPKDESAGEVGPVAEEPQPDDEAEQEDEEA